MDFRKHPDVLSGRASIAEMQKWAQQTLLEISGQSDDLKSNVAHNVGSEALIASGLLAPETATPTAAQQPESRS